MWLWGVFKGLGVVACWRCRRGGAVGALPPPLRGSLWPRLLGVASGRAPRPWSSSVGGVAAPLLCVPCPPVPPPVGGGAGCARVARPVARSLLLAASLSSSSFAFGFLFPFFWLGGVARLCALFCVLPLFAGWRFFWGLLRPSGSRWVRRSRDVGSVLGLLFGLLRLGRFFPSHAAQLATVPPVHARACCRSSGSPSPFGLGRPVPSALGARSFRHRFPRLSPVKYYGGNFGMHKLIPCHLGRICIFADDVLRATSV